MASLGGPNIVTNGLVLELDAGNVKSYPGNGSTWIDKSGNGNNGTLTNGPTFNSLNGGSIVFDGTNDYVNIGSATSVNYLGTGNFTIDCWINLSSIIVSGGGNIIGNYYTGGTGVAGDWQFCILKTNSTIFFYGTGPGYIFQDVPIDRGVWVNTLVTRNSGVLKFYMNSIEKASVNNTTDFTRVGGNLNIGIDGNNTVEPFRGNISIVRLYVGKGFSPSEVLQNYNALKSRYLP